MKRFFVIIFCLLSYCIAFSASVDLNKTGGVSSSDDITVRDLSSTGNTTIGNAATDSLTLNASTAVINNVVNGFRISTSTTASPIMSIDGANSRVGVGTTAPDSDLQLQKSAATVQFKVYDSRSNSADRARIYIQTDHNDSNSEINFANGALTWSIGIDGDDSDQFKISRASALGTNDVLKVGNAAVTIAGSLTTTGDVQLGDAATDIITFTGLPRLPTDAAPRTNITPSAAGELIWNSADAQLCVSTGTTASTWVQVSDGTTACAH